MIKKKYRFLMGCFLSALFLFTACSMFDESDQDYAYVEEGVLVEATLSPAGPGELSELFKRQITVFADGRLLLAVDENPEKGEPFIEKELSNSEMEKLKEKIEEEKFRVVAEDVSTSSEDGASYQITVHFADGEQTAEGWNPSDEQFNTLHEYIFDLIDEEEYKNWEEDMKAYLLEENQ